MTQEGLNKVIRIGGISFNKIIVGRRRIVEFKIANPTDNELIISSIYVQSIHQKNHLQDSLNAIMSSKHAENLEVFEITKIPKLPLTLANKTEVGCAISFSPSHSGWFNGILCIIPLSKHPVQQITLHGEGEFPTSPQQLLPTSNSLSLDARKRTLISPSKELEESMRAIGTTYTVSGSSFVAKDEDVEPPKQRASSSFTFSTTSVHNTPNKETTRHLTDSWADRFPNSDYADVDTSILKTPHGSTVVPHTPTVEMDIILQLQKRIQSLEEKFETLSLSLTKGRSSANREQSSPSLLKESLEVTEENEAILSESTAAFLKEMGTPLATRTSQNESWKEFVKAKSPHSPGFANFTANLAKRYETTTPQTTALYKTPLWNEELTFQDESADYSNTPFGKKPRL